MSVRCALCGQEWPQDPAWAVPCPQCHAPPGRPCRRPSGHGCDTHAARDAAAVHAGRLTPCPAVFGRPLESAL